MRITRIEIDNFKSLVGFSLDLAGFTCLIGLNGSGKSTILQAVDFLSCLFRGNVSGWLAQRQWQSADLGSQLIQKRNIDLSLHLTDGDISFHWRGTFNRTLLHCTQESLVVGGIEFFRVEGGDLSTVVGGNLTTFEVSDIGSTGTVVRESIKILFKHQGSILSQIKRSSMSKQVMRFREFMQQTTSLDLLAPQYLRQRTRDSGGGLGLGGERLSAFLHELSTAQRQKLVEQLRQCYPQLESLSTQSLRSGWKQLTVQERFGDRRLRTEARQVNDGMLRLMAILAELLTDTQFLLFDEIENGINPELVEFLLDTLIRAPQQILVTTHSPMILNYLEDDVARAGVQYIYKTPEGATRSVPFFSIPSLARKLEVMGPGEAFADTELSRLHEEIAEMPAADQDTGRAVPR